MSPWEQIIKQYALPAIKSAGNQSDVLALKKCSLCQEEKPLAEFYKRKERVNSFSAQCRSCMTIQQKARWQKIKKAKQCRADAISALEKQTPIKGKF